MALFLYLLLKLPFIHSILTKEGAKEKQEPNALPCADNAVLLIAGQNLKSKRSVCYENLLPRLNISRQLVVTGPPQTPSPFVNLILKMEARRRNHSTLLGSSFHRL